MNRTYKFAAGIGVIVVTVGFLMWTAVDQTKMYMVSVTEYLSAGDSYAGTTLRIAGRVAEESMEWDADTRSLHFVLEDVTTDGSIEVRYSGLLPDMFAEGRDVLVEGPYHGEDSFEATQVLTSCPSKYEAE